MTTSRDRLLDAARAIFAKGGLEGLSVRQVAAAAGLSPMAMYRHFADKDALVDALMRDGFEVWEKIVSGINTRDPIRWLEKLGDAYLDFALDDPHRFDAAFLLPARDARKYPDDFAAGRSPVIAMTMARIEEAQAKGALAPLPPLRIALMLSATLQGLVSMHRARRFASDAQFRALYRGAARDCLSYFVAKGKKP
jgi:AcrR family transcriptional regulator